MGGDLPGAPPTGPAEKTTVTIPASTLDEAVSAALRGQKTMTLCPAHDDHSPSLSVAPGVSQPVVFKCHAGCDQDSIVAAGELAWADICAPLDPDPPPDRNRWTPAGTASHIYPYRLRNGVLSFEVLRVPLDGGKKRFMQRRPDPTAPSGHAWNLDTATRVLYRLPEVCAAVRNGHTIHIAEGEKCVHALLAVIPDGDEATCNPMGAGKWTNDYATHLTSANVIIYADADDVGRDHARTIRESLLAVGATVKILEAPAGTMPSGKPINDVADHLEAGGPLVTLLETTPEVMAEKARTGIDILDVILRPRGRTEFAIDRTLAMGERLLLLGFEGTGKSTLCRQIAVCTAAGIHPFAGTEMDPKRVLFIDAENHPEQILDSWAQLVGLASYLGRPVERDRLIVMEEWEADRDLASPGGAAWLHERVHAYQPALIVMGPLTNLAGKDLRDDEPVRRLRNAVNLARTVCNTAFVMEHHAPLKSPMDKERALRPYGSSLFLKWPDYGYGLKPTQTEGLFEWHKNRGPRVRSRIWPEALCEGKPNSADWPWREAVLPI